MRAVSGASRADGMLWYGSIHLYAGHVVGTICGTQNKRQPNHSVDLTGNPSLRSGLPAAHRYIVHNRKNNGRRPKPQSSEEGALRLMPSRPQILGPDVCVLAVGEAANSVT